MTRTFDAPPRSGTFSDRTRAQAAANALISEAGQRGVEVDVALYGSQGSYVLLAATERREVEDWVDRVLREHGAVLQEQGWPSWLVEARNTVAQDIHGIESRATDEEVLLARWATVALLLVEHGVLGPEDLFALLLAAGQPADRLSAGERARRLKEADDELRDVSQRLEAALRTRHPDLFDRGGRLRPSALALRLAPVTGGKSVLTGDELRALEDEEDAAGRSMRAP
jgi:hypothetical protein